jgi:RNA polymerase primary sigma factor
MASKAKPTLRKEQVPQDDEPASLTDRPLLDLSDAAVKKLIYIVKKRGYLTHNQISALSKEVNSEQIEDVRAMFSEMGVNVVETEEASEDEEQHEEPEEETEPESSELIEIQRAVPAKSGTKEPIARTDDPVRMYLREMGSMELLSRQGEIAIAKRIEMGREAMIAGLCESPLTFQAIIIWRDELNEGKVFLRDIIDLEATYAGPDATPRLSRLRSLVQTGSQSPRSPWPECCRPGCRRWFRRRRRRQHRQAQPPSRRRPAGVMEKAARLARS